MKTATNSMINNNVKGEIEMKSVNTATSAAISTNTANEIVASVLVVDAAHSVVSDLINAFDKTAINAGAMELDAIQANWFANARDWQPVPADTARILGYAGKHVEYRLNDYAACATALEFRVITYIPDNFGGERELILATFTLPQWLKDRYGLGVEVLIKAIAAECDTKGLYVDEEFLYPYNATNYTALKAQMVIDFIGMADIVKGWGSRADLCTLGLILNRQQTNLDEDFAYMWSPVKYRNGEYGLHFGERTTYWHIPLDEFFTSKYNWQVVPELAESYQPALTFKGIRNPQSK